MAATSGNGEGERVSEGYIFCLYISDGSIGPVWAACFLVVHICKAFSNV